MVATLLLGFVGLLSLVTGVLGIAALTAMLRAPYRG